MSVPFSNTHLRVPRGFGTILEGLAREVLRDQPEDIPSFAAQYFEFLLTQREESGMDPAEWAAKLEDRFYNNHAFESGAGGPETELTKKKSNEAQTEDETSHLTEASHLSNTTPYVSENVDSLAESMGQEGEEEEHDIPEKYFVSIDEGPVVKESVDRFPAADVQPDERSGTEEEIDPTIITFDQVDTATDGKDSSSVADQDKVSQPEFEPTESLSLSNVEVSAREIDAATDVEADKKETVVLDKDIVDTEGEESSNHEELADALTYSVLADGDVCDTELGEMERLVEEATADSDEQESSKPQKNDAQATCSQSVVLDDNPETVEKTKEVEGTETGSSSVEIQESLTRIEGSLDSDATPKEDPLVEISFEDVPEAQKIEDVCENQPEEEGSGEVSVETKISDIKEEEKHDDFVGVAETPNTSGTQDHKDSDGEELESEHVASDIMKEKVDTNDSNLNDSDGNEKGEGIEDIVSSHQPNSKADEESPEHQIDHKEEDNERSIEGELHHTEDSERVTQSNEPDLEEKKTSGPAEGDEEGVHVEGHSEEEKEEDEEEEETKDVDWENLSSRAEQSNKSSGAMEGESESLEASAKHLPEENEESRRELVESQPEDTAAGEEVATNSLSPIADGPVPYHEGEERLLLSETEPEGNSNEEQEECSRPQEEEDIMDIPLDDPEANRAAAKIQAGFRGHMTRKKMKPEDKAEAEERQKDRAQ